jgi:hypothetical protein
MPSPTYAIQAIITKYLAPTNSLGARIKATAAAGSITVGWNYSSSEFSNHHAAAFALASKLDWLDNEYTIGALPDGGYVLAFVTT